MQRLEIENLGKLDHAVIRLGGLTLFAGPNNTGKSFVSKFLYSIFGAMKANPVAERLRRLIAPIQQSVGALDRGKHPSASAVINAFADMEKLARSIRSNNREAAEDLIYPLPHQIEELKQLVQKMKTAVEELKGGQSESTSELESSIVEDISKSLSKFEGDIKGADETWNFAASELEYRVAQNLVKNFQIPEISQLKGRHDSSLHAKIGDDFQVLMSDGEIKLKLTSSSLRAMSSLSNVVYLESPIYWKLSSALMDVEYFPSPFVSNSERGRLTAVPGYFHDLARRLRFEYTGGIAFPKVYEWLIGHDVINGKMSISSSGDMSFDQGGRSFSLQTTATGAANLGILALLIERKIVDHGTVLFIDEPEAHLHPAWQVVMAEALFRLAQGGVKVVIATHSLDILKWLEVWVKKHPDDEKIVALNQFPVLDGYDEPFDQRMANIKRDLTKPFFDLYLDGV